MTFDELSPELKEKARACRTPEDILALAKEEGYELSTEELDQIAGGFNIKTCRNKCPDRASWSED